MLAASYGCYGYRQLDGSVRWCIIHPPCIVHLLHCSFLVSICSISAQKRTPIGRPAWNFETLVTKYNLWSSSYCTYNPLGKFKGEIGENYRLLPIVSKTSSGIDNKTWICRLLDEYRKLNITSGPLFRNKAGLKIRVMDFEPCFFWQIRIETSLKTWAYPTLKWCKQRVWHPPIF